MKIKYIIIIFLVFMSFRIGAQISASPTRTTTDFTVTVTDTAGNFEPNDVNDDDFFRVELYYLGTPNLGNTTLWITDTFEYISPNQMSFRVRTAQPYDQYGLLYVAGVNTNIDIRYLAPTYKTLRNSNGSHSSDPRSDNAPNNVTRVSEIFTDWDRGDGNTFWRSNEWSNSDLSTWPNNRHNLLAFTYGEGASAITYSTGVDDQELIDRGISFVSQKFKAYSSNGVEGRTNRNHYLEYGDAVDGVIANSELSPPTEEDEEITSSEILGATIYNSIVDGINGLDLGTGITNFNVDVSVRFFSGNGKVGAIQDDIPDLLITQIADAGDSSRDIYYYADEDGNVVGRPISLNIRKDGNSDGPAMLARWIIDLFRFQNGISFSDAIPTEFADGQNDTKTIKMAAFKLQEFGIVNQASLDSINNINMAAGGNADIAFLAYNKDAFDIAAPDINRFPVSQFVCRLNAETDIQFNAIAKIDGKAEGEALTSQEELTYKWFKFNNTTGDTGTMTPFAVGAVLDIDDVVASDIGTYNLEISNSFGKVILPVKLEEGGTPAFWNGVDNFDLPTVYNNAGISVDPGNRNLIFTNNYNHPEETLTM